MKLIEKSVKLFLRCYPIKSNTPYRFVPLFFFLGAGIEWVMIKFPGAGKGETFYDVLRRKQSVRQLQVRSQEEEYRKFQERVLKEKTASLEVEKSSNEVSNQ